MSDTHSIEIRDLKVAFGDVVVFEKMNLDVTDGEFLVLLGASGCGKSTLLNCIAGLLDVKDGEIHIKGRNVTWEEPKDRGIGMVFQSYALYPQMSVKRNLSFGLRNAGVKNDEVERRVAQAADVLQIEPLLNRRPAELSGGQRQRVAIGRALVRDVDVFLFDEPLSNLDAALRVGMRMEISELHKKLDTTMIYVTHDQVEAMTLADKIVILRDGLIEQVGAPQTLYADPDNMFVGGFIGSPKMNFLEGRIISQTGASAKVALDGYPDIELTLARGRTHEGGERVAVGIRPEHVSSTGKVRLPVKIDVVENLGSTSFAYATTRNGGSLIIELESADQVKAGHEADIGFDPKSAFLFDLETGLRL